MNMPTVFSHNFQITDLHQPVCTTCRATETEVELFIGSVCRPKNWRTQPSMANGEHSGESEKPQ